LSLSPQEAADHLKDAELTAKRSAQAYSYQRFSPFLILWGIIWIVGYGLTYLAPHHANSIWLGLVLLAGVFSVLIRRRIGAGKREKTDVRYGLRYLGIFLIVFLFIGSVYAMFKPTSGMQMAAFPALLVGIVYMGLGLWSGARFIVTGFVLFAITISSYFYLPQYLMPLLALAGGGSLILAGIWFRKV
jgi:hypothetical protein